MEPSCQETALPYRKWETLFPFNNPELQPCDFFFIFTLRIELHVEPHLVGDERVVRDVLDQKIVLLFGFDGQDLSTCQQEVKGFSDLHRRTLNVL